MGTTPVVQGGARYSDLAPRDPQDELGQHPVFIDALSFDSPSDLADYLVWLHRTGNASNYRPWLRLPDKARAGAGEGAQQQSAAGAETPDRHAGWPCSHSDVVRCGMAGMRLTLDPATCGASLVTTVHRQLGREPDLRRVCHQRIRGAGDAGIARQSGLGLSEVSGAWAPWRLPGADPTLDEYRRLHGLPRGRLGAGDLVLDQDRCRGCEPGQVCVATAATEARLRSTRSDYWATWPAGSAPCEWTTDRDDWQSADAIVFVPTYFDLAEIPDPKLKPLGQLWVLAGAEQPRLRARPEVLDALVDHVDLWGTPDERSDLWSIYPLPDPNQWRAGSGARRHRRDVDTGPSTFVFAAISNCDELLTRRLEIVKGVAAQLQKVAPVLANRSRFRGKCLSGKMDSDRLQQRQTALHDTEFALAFENSFYPDYATEKLFDALDVGAIPVVQGGARYSDLAPRDPQDELGQHPVFIDALSFDSPSDLADYLVWLHRTGNASNYRPWLRLPDKARAEAGEGAQQQSAAGAEAPDRHAGWPCSHSDVVRCGMAGMRLTLDPATCGASLVATVHRQLGREPDLRRVCHQRIRGAGDAGIARQSGLGLSEVSGAWAPWRLPGADPTLDEYRRLHGLPRGRLGAGDLVLDQDRCRGCEPGQVCVATAATEARLRSTRSDYWATWVKSFEAGTCK